MQVDPQTVGNIFGALLVGGYGAVRLISYVKSRRNGNTRCPDPTCNAQVMHTAEAVNKLEKTINRDVFPKINRIAEDLEFIRGWVEAKKG